MLEVSVRRSSAERDLYRVLVDAILISRPLYSLTTRRKRLVLLVCYRTLARQLAWTPCRLRSGPAVVKVAQTIFKSQQKHLRRRLVYRTALRGHTTGVATRQGEDGGVAHPSAGRQHFSSHDAARAAPRGGQDLGAAERGRECRRRRAEVPSRGGGRSEERDGPSGRPAIWR